MTKQNQYMVYEKKNRFLLLTAVLLSAVGVIFIWDLSAASEFPIMELKPQWRQLVVTIFGVILALVMSGIHYQRVVLGGKILFGVLMILVFVSGIWPAFGDLVWEDQWIRIYGIGIKVSDLFQCAACIVLAEAVSIQKKKWTGAAMYLLCSCVLSIGVLLLLKDFTNLAILLAIAVLLLLITRTFIIGLAAVPVALILYPQPFFEAVFRLKERCFAWQNAFDDRFSRGFETVQSLYASASGGLFGTGLGNTNIPNSLPGGTNLLILAGIARETGIVGAAAVLLIYLFILYQAYAITCAAAEGLGFCLGAAITLYFMVPFIFNILLTVGLMPVAGISIPFLSYGGTSQCLDFAMIGILLNISKYREVRE